MEEILDVINAKNVVIAQVTQEEVYNRKLNHRIVHIFVIHPSEDRVYLQKRSESKSFLPGYYCTSAGGHVKSGESYLEAAKRELYEEIGLKTQLYPIHTTIFESDNHKRFIQTVYSLTLLSSTRTNHLRALIIKQ